MKSEQELRDAFPIFTRAVHIARGALRLLRPHIIEQHVKEHVDALSTNEAIHRLLRHRAERDKMIADIRAETVTARQRAAGVALYPLHAAAAHVQEWRAWLRATKANVSLSFPDALVGVDRNGLILLGLARFQVRDQLRGQSVAALLDTYGKAQPRRNDPMALLETEAIEALLDSGAQLAVSDADLPRLKELHTLVNDCQALRVPDDLPDYEALAADISRLQARASAAQIAAVSPEQNPEASAYFAAQEAELLEAGAGSDRDDIEAVQKDLAAASGQ